MFKDFDNSIVISSMIGHSAAARLASDGCSLLLVVGRRVSFAPLASPTSLGPICSRGGLSSSFSSSSFFSSFSSFFLFPAQRWLELLQLYGERAVWAVRKTVRAVVGIRI